MTDRIEDYINMSYTFFVVMRTDGKLYDDLHKTDENIYLDKADAEKAIQAMGTMSEYFHVVEMVAVTREEWDNDEELKARKVRLVKLLTELLTCINNPDFIVTDCAVKAKAFCENEDQGCPSPDGEFCIQFSHRRTWKAKRQ